MEQFIELLQKYETESLKTCMCLYHGIYNMLEW